MVLYKALAWAMLLLRAERGNIQLRDPVTGLLSIAAQHGFAEEFLAHFASVGNDGSACGRAAHQRGQIVIRDVRTDPGFAPHRAVAAASGFRAVQSTPVLAPAGRVLGVISTHYPRAGGPMDLDLVVARRLGELLGEALSRGTPDRGAAVGNRTRTKRPA
jgi:GAF domain-containing protein